MAGSGPSSNHTDLIAGSPAVITRGGGYIRTPRDAVMVKDTRLWPALRSNSSAASTSPRCKQVTASSSKVGIPQVGFP